MSPYLHKGKLMGSFRDELLFNPQEKQLRIHVPVSMYPFGETAYNASSGPVQE